jgi:hypothetical protein
VSGGQVQLLRVATEPALQLVSQDGRIQFWHILQKELVHPKLWYRRLLVPHDSCVIEEKDVPREVMQPGAVSQLQHPMILARQHQVMIPKVPQLVVHG